MNISSKFDLRLRNCSGNNTQGIQIMEPAIQNPNNNKYKQIQVVPHDVIEIDEDEDGAEVLIINKEVNKNNKGKSTSVTYDMNWAHGVKITEGQKPAAYTGSVISKRSSSGGKRKDHDIGHSWQQPVRSLKNPTGFNGSTGPCHGSSRGKMAEEEPEVLKKFRMFKHFDIVHGCSNHHFIHNVSNSKQAPQKWSKTIQDEWKILKKDLPDTIFVRVYEERMDLLRAVIVGAAGTPYHDGLFFFDVFFPSNYPSSPPVVHYYSHGHRLNPNLYACGKVCLSLLNTWRGNKNEHWTPGKSTMLQVLLSIQALVLNAKPYFNEPGYERTAGTKVGEKHSQDYNESTFILSCKTMLHTLRSPPKHFEEFVAGYFRSRALAILVSCKAYTEGAQVGCLVEGGVQDVDEGQTSCSVCFKTQVQSTIMSLVEAFKKNGAIGCEQFLLPKPEGPEQRINNSLSKKPMLYYGHGSGSGSGSFLVLILCLLTLLIFGAHLHFADDTIVFLDAKEEQIDHLRFILLCFELVSGLHANLAKSSVLGVGDVNNLGVIASSLGCGVCSLPTSYLGLPLGAKAMSVAKWSPVVERYDKKLAAWKKPLLSKGGKLILVQSVLTSLPLYFLSLFHMPMSIVNKIERIIRNFLWDERDGKKRLHLVNWETITKPKKMGGLGIRKMKEMNISLLSKWLWRYGEEVNSLWRIIITEKYGTGFSVWEPKLPKATYGSSVWRGICNSWSLYEDGIEFDVHNGSKVRFWEDRWLEDKCMMLFPNLFRLSRTKGECIRDLIRVENNSVSWNLGLNRRLPDIAIHELACLLGKLDSRNWHDVSDDNRIWRWEKNKVFTVKSMFKKVFVRGGDSYPIKHVWSSNIPTKVSFFLWTALHEKITTIDNLQRRGWHFANRCFLCKKDSESPNHILLHCDLAHSLWSIFFSKFGVSWSHQNSVKLCMESWRLQGMTGRRREMWKFLPAAIFWSLWMERNKRVFDSKEEILEKLVNNVIFLIFSWVTAAGGLRGVSLDEIIGRWDSVVFDPG